jgi:hypothetical protein
MFLSEKDKVVAELSDENWLLYSAFVYGITHHLRDLNTKLSAQQKLVSDILRESHNFRNEAELFPT